MDELTSIAKATDETATDPLTHTHHTRITTAPAHKPSVSSKPSNLRFINNVPTHHPMEHDMKLTHPPTFQSSHQTWTHRPLELTTTQTLMESIQSTLQTNRNCT